MKPITKIFIGLAAYVVGTGLVFFVCDWLMLDYNSMLELIIMAAAQSVGCLIALIVVQIAWHAFFGDLRLIIKMMKQAISKKK